MKTTVLFLLCILLAGTSISQNVTSSTGTEIDLPNREKKVKLLHADESGVWVLQQHYKHANYLFKDDLEQTLFRFDNNNKIVFQKKVEDEAVYQYLKGSFYGFSSRFISKERRYVVELVQLSAKDGALVSPRKEIISVPLLTKEDEFMKNISVLPDSSGFSVRISQATEKENRLFVHTIHDNATNTGQVTIPYGRGKEVNDLESSFIDAGRIIIVASNYDYTTAKRKKKFLKSFTVTTYSNSGEMSSQVEVALDDKFINSVRFFPLKDGKMMATGFYSVDMDHEYTNGAFTIIIDLATGTITNKFIKELNRKVIGYAKESDKKALNGLDGIFRIEALLDNPATGGYVIVTEHEERSGYSSTGSYNTNLSKGFYGTTTSTSSVSHMGDILLFGADKSGNIQWMNNISKKQHEFFAGSGSALTDFPYFSSFAIMSAKDRLHLLLNDHPKNGAIVGTTDDFKKTDFNYETNLYLISVDYTTGAITRKTIEIPDTDGYIFQPKNYAVYNNVFYIPSTIRRNLRKGGFKINRFLVN